MRKKERLGVRRNFFGQPSAWSRLRTGSAVEIFRHECRGARAESHQIQTPRLRRSQKKRRVSGWYKSSGTLAGCGEGRVANGNGISCRRRKLTRQSESQHLLHSDYVSASARNAVREASEKRRIRKAHRSLHRHGGTSVKTGTRLQNYRSKTKNGSS
jgi:hypothetical protein